MLKSSTAESRAEFFPSGDASAHAEHAQHNKRGLHKIIYGIGQGEGGEAKTYGRRERDLPPGQVRVLLAGSFPFLDFVVDGRPGRLLHGEQDRCVTKFRDGLHIRLFRNSRRARWRFGTDTSPKTLLSGQETTSFPDGPLFDGRSYEWLNKEGRV